MATEATKVLIADEHGMFREGVAALFAPLPDLAVVGEAATSAQVLEHSERAEPDVVVLSLSLPGDALEVVADLKRRLPEVKIVVLDGAGDDPQSVYRAVRAGATGYLPKSGGIDTLIAAVRQAALCQVAIPAETLTRFVGFIAGVPQESHPVAETLSRREEDVLELVAQGKSNREIAQTLCIAESTARSHLHHILGKLGMTSRVQAAMYMLERRRGGPRRAAVGAVAA